MLSRAPAGKREPQHEGRRRRMAELEAQMREANRRRVQGRRRITADQERVCARCGVIKWFHEPGRAWDTDHEFTEVMKCSF